MIKNGILKPDYVDPDNGYRYYSADQLDFLDNISMLKEIGLSLDEIRTFMEQRTRDYAVSRMEEQLASIRQKIKRLQTIEKQLSWKMKTLEDLTSKQEGVFLIRHENAGASGRGASLLSKNGEKGTDEEDLMAQNIAIKRLMTKAKREHYPYFYQQGSLIPLDELQEGHYLRASHVFLPLEKKVRRRSVHHQAARALRPLLLYGTLYGKWKRLPASLL